jgi:YHS domain-containing protein
MSFLARLFRFIFWVLIVSWSLSLLRRVVNAMGTRATPERNDPLDVPNDAVARKLVRDPVCGMHLAEGLALVAQNGGRQFYFCSEECRNKFIGEAKKFVANG